LAAFDAIATSDFCPFGFFSQTDMHPPITESSSREFNDAKVLQPTATNLFLDWEKTKGLDNNLIIDVVTQINIYIKAETFN
jgi:hypothetical protein